MILTSTLLKTLHIANMQLTYRYFKACKFFRNSKQNFLSKLL